MRVVRASDASVLVRVEPAEVLRLFHALRSDPHALNLHPAYDSVLVDFDPLRVSAAELEETVRQAAVRAPAAEVGGTLVEIPVCYEAEFAPDLEFVAKHVGLPAGEVVRLHASAEYRVAFLGFSPGFAYLTGLPRELATPRLESPRRRVAAGSVGIAGGHTGVYPLDSPGGWRLIGRTPLKMFDAMAERPTRLAPGDAVRFVAIGRAEFERLGAQP